MKKFLLRALLAGVLAGAAFAAYLWATFPDVSALAKENPETTPFMEWKKGRGAALAKRRFVPYREISPHLKEAVRKSEDFAFFEHGGFDFAEMKAAWRDSREKKKKLRGASTLTMQTARLMFLTPERSAFRKLREALITMSLEKHLPKERIFELYLNYADWGRGAFGAEAAARRHFGKSCRELACSEAVSLAAMLPNPDARDPAKPTRAMTRHIRRLSGKVRCMGGKEEAAKSEPAPDPAPPAEEIPLETELVEEEETEEEEAAEEAVDENPGPPSQ